MDSEIRRVVTTHEADGKAIVMLDGPTPNKVSREGTGNVSRLMWVTESTPADISGKQDNAARKIGIPPPPMGSVFRIVDFPPLSGDLNLPADYMARSMGDGHAPSAGWPSRHSFMHRTRTIDYAIVMSGEIDMLLDDSEIHLRAGDVLVQQGTNHAWVNRGAEPCRIAFVLIDAVDPMRR